MKRTLFILLTILFSTILFAKQETLISGDIESGGFGGPVCKIGNVYDKTALIIGGRGGWIINHQFVLGGGAYGLVTDIPSKIDGNFEMTLGYGGLEIEYIKQPNKLTHLSLMVLLGGGGVNFSKRNREDWERNKEYDSFYIAEPSVHFLLNVTPFFRLGLGGSYRFIAGVNPNTELYNKDLAGPTMNITFKFGTF